MAQRIQREFGLSDSAVERKIRTMTDQEETRDECLFHHLWGYFEIGLQTTVYLCSCYAEIPFRKIDRRRT